MIVGKDEHLGLSSQPPERRRVQNSIPVPFKAGASRVGLFRSSPPPCANNSGGTGCEDGVLQGLAFLSSDGTDGSDRRRSVAVRKPDASGCRGGVSFHGAGPPLAPFCDNSIGGHAIQATEGV